MVHLKQLAETLHALSDADFQRRAWLGLDQSIDCSLTEMLCQTFDDTGLCTWMDADRCPDEVDAELFLALKQLDAATSELDTSLDPVHQLSSQHMANVRERARAALTVLERVRGQPPHAE